MRRPVNLIVAVSPAVELTFAPPLVAQPLPPYVIELSLSCTTVALLVSAWKPSSVIPRPLERLFLLPAGSIEIVCLPTEPNVFT